MRLLSRPAPLTIKVQFEWVCQRPVYISSPHARGKRIVLGRLDRSIAGFPQFDTCIVQARRLPLILPFRDNDNIVTPLWIADTGGSLSDSSHDHTRRRDFRRKAGDVLLISANYPALREKAGRLLERFPGPPNVAQRGHGASTLVGRKSAETRVLASLSPQVVSDASGHLSGLLPGRTDIC